MRAVWLVAVIAACAPALPDAPARPVELPSSFEGGAAGASISSLDWATYFGDDRLNTLVGEALRGNFDLQLAVQRIEIARAPIREIAGARLPQLSLEVGGGVRKYARYTVEGAGNVGTEIAPGQQVPTVVPDLSAALVASWEPDLWGRLSHAQGAARARYLASIEARHLVVTTLVADVATAYFSLVALDDTAHVLDETIAHQTRALEMMRVQKDAGRTNELAVSQFAAQLATTRALAARVQADSRELELELSFLMGRQPAPIARDDEALSRPLPALAVGVPSELLRSRPDVREAELELQAARLDVAVARLAFYPHLRISSDLGYEAFDPRFLLRTPASIAYSLVAGLVAPLVNRRGIEAAFSTANAMQVSAMVAYQRIVLRSFIDVEAGLSTLQRTAEIVEQQTQKRDALADSVDASTELFRAGKATYVEVLLAQQQTLQAELELITARRDQQIAKVRLYKAVGGGWAGPAATP